MGKKENKETHRSPQVQAVLKVQKILFRDVVSGIRQIDIANEMGVDSGTVYRWLCNLELAGDAVQIEETKRWKLTTVLPKHCNAMLLELDKCEKQIQNLKHNYSRIK